MKMAAVALCLLVVAGFGSQAQAAQVSPIAKIIQMISDLESKVILEGEDAHKLYAEFSEFCEDKSKNLEFDIKTATAEVEDLKASIAKEEATTGELTAKVDELSGNIATDEADLKAATEIRAQEFADFSAEEKELVSVVDMMDRAISILKREMAKSGASMLQLKNAGSITDALRVMVQGAMLSSVDGAKLTALVQSSNTDDDSEDDNLFGAPAAAVYEGHAGNIVDTLEDLLSKAEGKLNEARKTETQNKNNFEMLKQSLSDEVKFGEADMEKAKKGLAESGEKKAGAQGELAVTSKDLAADVAVKGDLHGNCMAKASDFESEVKSRDEELKALAKAKQIIQETTGGATSQQYSFLQFSQDSRLGSALRTGTDLANFEVVRFVRDLARKYNSPALTQLSSRMAYAMRFGSSNGGDPFAKIKGLIADMIEKLEDAAEADATEKAYCDKEIGETTEKKDDKNGEIEKLSTKIDQMSARSAKLKEEIAALQKSLADLAGDQSEMNKLRSEEKTAFTKNKAEMEQGLEGVKMALKVLRDYYAQGDKAHSSADGAGAGIVGLLEVCESDFSKSLAEMIATEESAVSQYESETKDNEIEKTTKDQDVKYKTKESTDLDKSVAEHSADRSGVQAELDAVMEYMRSLEARCIAKPTTYADTKERREQEISGLKEALSILEGEAMLLQQNAKRALRGAAHA